MKFTHTMQLFLTILVVIIIFSLLVLIHELGHFWAARRAGVKVIEFGFGFPPRIWGRKKSGTLYSINAIPFGGFVKLLGEDMHDPAALKSPRSFIRKSKWTRTKIIIAGVFMNFLLAYVLLTAGFTFGIQPLILNENDLFNYINQGVVQSRPGIFIKDVKHGSIAQKAGLTSGDQILQISQKPISELLEAKKLETGEFEKDIDLLVKKAGETKEIHLTAPVKEKDFGLKLKEAMFFPRPAVASVDKKSLFGEAGFLKDDIVLRVNQKPVYTPAETLTFLSLEEKFDFEILRGQEGLVLHVGLAHSPRILISEIMPGYNAEKSGFRKGDFLVSINDVLVVSPEQVQGLLKDSKSQQMKFSLRRDSKKIEIEAGTDAKNTLGIGMNTVVIPIEQGISFYQSAALTSIVKVNNVEMPVYSALSTALVEIGRLTKLTAIAFVNTLKNIVTKLSVPEDVGGPVQIAYYTGTFVKEGFFALLRFTAILSLSLGVINILPIPALDGGRFLFILIEAIFKKRVNARLEYLIHSIGFILIMLLILMVTYSDLAKIL